MFENLPISLQELNFVTIIFRMVLAIIIGGIIGTERDMKHRAAGLRTHMLVTLGATIVMMTNEYIFEIYRDSNIDITRMAAQVVSGIGFIGAGTILVTSENRVKGLTTAAGLWAAAAIGLAIGIGFYEIALVGGLAIVIIFILMRPFKRFIHSVAAESEITLIIHSKKGFNDLLSFISEIDVKIATLEIENELMNERMGEDAGIIYTVTLVLGDNISKDYILEQLSMLENVMDVVEVEV